MNRTYLDGTIASAYRVDPPAQLFEAHVQVCQKIYRYGTGQSDGQGPQGFSFVFLDLFDFFDLFADLARACLGFLERKATFFKKKRTGN
jgi:hypothetical protein